MPHQKDLKLFARAYVELIAMRALAKKRKNFCPFKYLRKLYRLRNILVGRRDANDDWVQANNDWVQHPAILAIVEAVDWWWGFSWWKDEVCTNSSHKKGAVASIVAALRGKL